MNPDRFRRAYPPTQPPASAPARYLPFVGGRDLVTTNGTLLSGTVGEPLPLAIANAAPLYLGDLDGAACLAYAADERKVAEASLAATGLRSLFDTLPTDEYALAGYASHLLGWEETSRFCPKSGDPTAPTPNAWAKTCTVCGYTVYPLVSPAVLILVYDDAGRILLSHKPGWGERYSILAGFVEPGETPEECVARETREEVGLRVEPGSIAYKGSQPWPYPNQLMLGFTARCSAPETPIVLDETELDRAAWFAPGALPPLPGKLSLSRALIDAWLAEGDAKP